MQEKPGTQLFGNNSIKMKLYSDNRIQININNFHGKNKIIFLGRSANSSRGKFECFKCKNIWEARIESVTSRTGCRKCVNKRIKQSNRQIQDRVNNIHGKNIIKFIARLDIDSTRGKFECLKCGNIWKTAISNPIRGHGCKKCAFKKFGIEKRQSDTLIQKRINKKLGKNKIEFLGRLPTKLSNGKFRCLKCGHIWKTTIQSVINGSIPSLIQGHNCSLSKTFKIKKFRLNKKPIYIQGYEPQALKWLRDNTNLEANQIIAGDYKKIPIINYFNKNPGRQRKYYPDFYIPDRNIIVEVKSSWSFLINKLIFENIKLKRKAVLKEGYKFRLMVMTGRGYKIKIPKNWYNLNYNQIKNDLNRF